jgi:hypothetical protein
MYPLRLCAFAFLFSFLCLSVFSVGCFFVPSCEICFAGAVSQNRRLAAWAEVGAALADDDTRNERAATRAGKSVAAKHVECVGIASAMAGHAVKIIRASAERRPAIVDAAL